MSFNLPPRGSEEARQVLSTFYALLTSHPSPVECLGFPIGPGVPLPSVAEIQDHSSKLQNVFHELCESREEFLKYDRCLTKVRNRAIRQVSAKSPERMMFEAAMTAMKGLTLGQGVAPVALQLAYGVVFSLGAFWLARGLVLKGSPWLPLAATALFLLTLVAFFKWYADYAKSKSLALVAALTASLPLAMYHFTKSEGLLRGFEKELTPQALTLLMPSLGCAGFMCGLMIVRSQNDRKRFEASENLRNLNLDFTVPMLPEGKWSSLKRKSVSGAKSVKSSVWLSAGIPAACTLGLVWALGKEAFLRAPLLPPSSSEVAALHQADKLNRTVSVLTEKLNAADAERKDSERKSASLSEELEKRGRDADKRFKGYESKLAELQEKIEANQVQQPAPSHTEAQKRLIEVPDTTKSLAMMLIRKNEWTTKRAGGNMTFKFGSGGGVIAVDYRLGRTAAGSWEALSDDRVLVTMTNGQSESKLEIQHTGGKIMGSSQDGSKPEELLPIPSRLTGGGSGF